MTARSHAACAFGAALAAAAILAMPMHREVSVSATDGLCVSGETCASAQASRGDIATGLRYRPVHTHYGILALSYLDGRAGILGNLSAGGSCAGWKVDAEEGASPWFVVFSVRKTEPLLMGQSLCVEGVSERQAVSAEALALPETLYLIRLEGEVIFAGPLVPAPAPAELVFLDMDEGRGTGQALYLERRKGVGKI